jgi:hypothetical protein
MGWQPVRRQIARLSQDSMAREVAPLDPGMSLTDYCAARITLAPCSVKSSATNAAPAITPTAAATHAARSRQQRRQDTCVTSLRSAVTPAGSGTIGAAWAVPKTAAKIKPAAAIANAVRLMFPSHSRLPLRRRPAQNKFHLRLLRNAPNRDGDRMIRSAQMVLISPHLPRLSEQSI